ncbi:hypothetical protein AXK56_10690 [Tsukamurella pulmonis]|uniref:Uncharacterized protein n=1 Tax=Tsukamurella pulmonis TaxID=47312 RepID=A0A1H1GBV5_9ACTN|nr:hypothetical protein AXK56_10690 [Tsukamurella pulmonis]SDR10637.1 hypothetical protein SAMN04489765_3237 [Tsukamurella pulmonis]SUP17512.1 Uncharacterised protein [Tsukamurella pulmonis]
MTQSKLRTVSVGDRNVTFALDDGDFCGGGVQFFPKTGVLVFNAAKFLGKVLCACCIELVPEVSLHTTAKAITFATQITDFTSRIRQFSA